MAIVALLLTPVSWLIMGFCVSKLWIWFVVPVTDWPALGLWHAVGIVLTVQLMTGVDDLYRHLPGKENTDLEERLASIIVGVIGPFFTLLVGMLVRMFMRG